MLHKLPFVPSSSQRQSVCADFEYIGAGSHRNFCFTDLLLRERRNTDLAHLTSANWAIILVKGTWDLSLPHQMSLAEAVEHPNYREEVVPALQQVCIVTQCVDCSTLITLHYT